MFISFAVDAVNGNTLLQFVHQARRPRRVIGLRVLALQTCSQVLCVGTGFVGLLVLVVGGVHIGRRCLPPCRLVQRLGSLGTLRGIVGILEVQLRFFLRALLRALPVAANLVIQHVVGGQIGPLAAWIHLLDLLHLVIVKLLAKVVLLFMRRGPRKGVFL